MKKFLLTILCAMSLSCVYVVAEQISSVNGQPRYQSHSGIIVESVVGQSDGSYSVKFFNTNRKLPYRMSMGEYSPLYEFEWYLSYKGERVSDYFTSIIPAKEAQEKTVFAWPDEVPKGYEKYVTVQLGRAPAVIHKDRRDDD